jgi:hypothetical protein
LSKTYARIVNPSPAELDRRYRTPPPGARRSADPGARFERPLDQRIADAAIAA